MTYTEPLFNQISRFVTSIGFGFIICILYFLLFFLRNVISDKRWAIIVQDIIFGVLATVISFFYMIIYNNGEVRLNLLIGEITGAVVLYCTVGKYIIIFLERTAVVIRKITGNILLPLNLYYNAFRTFYKKSKSNIIELKNKKQEKTKINNEKEPKKDTKNKTNKNIKKRKNNTLKPLKNRNKSV